MRIELLSDCDDDASVGEPSRTSSPSASWSTTTTTTTTTTKSRVINAHTVREEIRNLHSTFNRIYREQAQSVFIKDESGFPAFALRASDATVELFQRGVSAVERHAVQSKCSARFRKYIADAPFRTTVEYELRKNELQEMMREAKTFDDALSIAVALDDIEYVGNPVHQFFTAVEFLRREATEGTLHRPNILMNLRIVNTEKFMTDVEGFFAYRMSRLWSAITDAAKAADAATKDTTTMKNKRMNTKKRNKKKSGLGAKNQKPRLGEMDIDTQDTILELGDDIYEDIGTLHDVIDRFTKLQEFKPFFYDIVTDIAVGIMHGDVEGMRTDGFVKDIEDTIQEFVNELQM